MNQSIPECIKRLLEASGYDTEISLSTLNEANLLKVELFAQRSLQHVIAELHCCHSETYRNETTFQFIPGTFILEIPKGLQSNSRPVTLSTLCQQLIDRLSTMPMATDLLKEFLKTVVTNESTSKTQNRYSEVIQYFSTYIYMLCGRNCYEVLSNNLPMPKAVTVCGFFSYIDFFVNNFNLF